MTDLPHGFSTDFSKARFASNAGRSAEYRQAYRAAIKDAVTWLHDEAKSMDDPHAVVILNNAAFHMGVDAKRPTPGDDVLKQLAEAK